MRWLSGLLRFALGLVPLTYNLFGLFVAVGFLLNLSRAGWPAVLWIALGLAAFLGGYFYGIPRLLQIAEDGWHRRSFRGLYCPACNTLYDRRAIRRSQHLLKIKTVGGPPPKAFRIAPYEAWELVCESCGHKQDFDASGNTIPADGPAWADDPEFEEEG